MIFETRFSVGDIVTCKDKTNSLFRRDCIVVYVDPSFFGVISDGLDEIFFIREDDDSFEMSKSGTQTLDDGQSAMLEDVLKKWALINELAKFPGLVESELNVLGVNQENMVRVAITANIPAGLMNYWRRFRAVLELSRTVHPEIPQDVEQLMATWAVLSAHKIIPVILTKNMLEGGGEG